MGSRPSSSENNQLANFPTKFLLQLAFPKLSEKFEKAEFFFKTQEMKIHIPINQEQTLRDWDQRISLVQCEELQSYLLMPKAYEFQKQGICGSAGIVKVTYGFFPYSLERQIENRKTSIENQNFTEQQLWKLLYYLLKAANLMHKYWRKVGDIRPKNVFYNQEKQLRISCQYSYPEQMTNYSKFLLQGQPTYLAPQQLADISMGRIEPKNNLNAKQQIVQAQSWSIGLTMLHAALLFNFQRIYEPLKAQINMEILNQKIQDIEKSSLYSNALKNTIKAMLQPVPSRRLLCSELLDQILQPHNFFQQNKKNMYKQHYDRKLKEYMNFKCANSLVNTVWKACTTGLIESLVLQTNRTSKLQNQQKTQQALLKEIDKFSEIPPKNSQVSMRDSIRLGSSRARMRCSLSKRRTSQVSCQSFQTVNSIVSSKKSQNINAQLYGNNKKISNFGIQSRFAPLTTHGDHQSLKKMSTSDKFQTPFDQSSYFQSIYGEKSFEFNQFGLMSERFKKSQAHGESQYQSKQLQKVQEENQPMYANFKKDKR